MIICSSRVAGIFPVQLHGAILVDKHSVSDGAGKPAVDLLAFAIRCLNVYVRVTAHTCVTLISLPLFLVYPLVLTLVDAVLLECRLVACIPKMHAFADVEGFLIGLSIGRRKCGSIAITIEIAVPASLKSDGVRIKSFQFQIINRAIGPHVCGITVASLLDGAVLSDIEDTPFGFVVACICDDRNGRRVFCIRCDDFRRSPTNVAALEVQLHPPNASCVMLEVDCEKALVFAEGLAGECDPAAIESTFGRVILGVEDTTDRKLRIACIC